MQKQLQIRIQTDARVVAAEEEPAAPAPNNNNDNNLINNVVFTAPKDIENFDEPINTIYLDLIENMDNDEEGTGGGGGAPETENVYDGHNDDGEDLFELNNVVIETSNIPITSSLSTVLIDEVRQIEINSPPPPPSKTIIKRSRSSSISTVLADDELIRNWCDMQCTQCSKMFHRFPEVKTHYRDEHNCNGFITCCKRKFFRRVRVLEHIGRHINPNLFR